MWLTIEQIAELGITNRWVCKKIASGEWQSRDSGQRGRNGKPIREVLISSLPSELQLRYLQQNPRQNYEDTRSDQRPISEEGLTAALKRLPLEEREAWINEALRLSRVIERYSLINPKRVRDSKGKLDFVPEVWALCREAACSDPAILAREPHRAQCPSPFTLDGWARRFKKDGLLTFFRSLPSLESKKRDRRKAVISEAAVDWVNTRWRNYRSPRHLYRALEKKAKAEGWTIPAEAWMYRRWRALSEPLKTLHLQGEKAYVSKHAPYVPRDLSDLAALQVLCGDHSQRDVTVRLKDGTLARPWLTTWQDLRTGLIWGWHLDLTPSSHTAGLAYADGVMNFGAQPPSNPDQDIHSYVYTDQGKDYKSRNWDGNVIGVHEHAMKLDGGIEVLLVQRQVGFLEELSIKHLLARGYNAREKPVERYHRDISDWEENTFEEFCGRDAKNKPDKWRALYAHHQRLLKRGKAADSPVIFIDDYREALAGFITEYNSTEHQRLNLGGARIVPLEEFNRLYTTHFQIREETIAMLLMKAEKRSIRKNGVQLFRPHWFFYHPAMAEFKGQDVEVRYADGDYSRVWVFLPNGQPCEAQLITPTSLLNPNKQTLKVVSEASARERKVMREANLITHSILRGETTEDRAVALIEQDEVELVEAVAAEGGGGQSRVPLLTRMDRPKLRVAQQKRPVTVAEVSSVDVDDSIYEAPERGRVSEFDFEE